MLSNPPPLIPRSEYRRRQFRVAPLVALFALSALLVAMRLGQLQVQDREVLAAEAAGTRLHTEDIQARRGRIFDSQGHVLAMDIPCAQVEVDPQAIKGNIGGVADQLSVLLNVPRAKLQQELSVEESWIVLPYVVSNETALRIQKLELPGVTVNPVSQRFYPANELAAHVLGFVAGDHKGYYGIEGEQDRVLRGTAGTLTTERAAATENVAIAGAERSFSPARDGSDLYLTIDRAVQYAAEDELERGLREFGAPSGSIIVVDVRTGYVLAMAIRPAFDPNKYEGVPAQRFQNPATSAQYEPGSVFKLVTMAAAFDSGALQPEDSFYCAGEISIGGEILRPWDRKAHGVETMSEVLIHSCNVGAAYANTKTGADAFYRYVFDFGFAKPMGIELQGEVKGKVLLPGERDWYPINLGTNAFGQGLAVTPLQMVMAVATIANDGVRMKPQVVARVVQPDVQIVSEPAAVKRVIQSDTARKLTTIMAEAVEKEAPLALVPGYRVAGKTGTAQIPIAGGYDPRWTIASFVGFLPVDNPQIVILVKIDRPSTSPWGTQVAAPIFSRVAQRLVVLLGIPPDGAR